MNRVSEYDIRKGKIQTLRELGIVPFAQTWAQKNRISDVTEGFLLFSMPDDIL